MEGIKWNNVPNTKSCAVDLYVALLPQHTTYNLYVINKHLHNAASSLAPFPCSVPFQPWKWGLILTFGPQLQPLTRKCTRDVCLQDLRTVSPRCSSPLPQSSLQQGTRADMEALLVEGGSTGGKTRQGATGRGPEKDGQTAQECMTVCPHCCLLRRSSFVSRT